MFALSPRSIATVLAAELVAFGVVAGPRAPLKVAAGTLFAMGTVQTWRWLILVSSVLNAVCSTQPAGVGSTQTVQQRLHGCWFELVCAGGIAGITLA